MTHGKENEAESSMSKIGFTFLKKPPVSFFLEPLY